MRQIVASSWFGKPSIESDHSMDRGNSGRLEEWNDGCVSVRNGKRHLQSRFFLTHYSNTPLLQYSILIGIERLTWTHSCPSNEDVCYRERFWKPSNMLIGAGGSRNMS
jgi:hypothetical protein